jgi:peptidoglycan/LPS O-acetylase OafA/YrhL
MKPALKPLKFFPAFDGVRGVAIFLVMLAHSNTYGGGILGVDLFFVLSGFLITSVLMNERDQTGTISFPSFFARRILRLFPALVAFVSMGYILTRIVYPEFQEFLPKTALFATLFYWINWYVASHPTFTGVSHCWSLAIEEQFYLLWPLFLWIMLRFKLPIKRVLVITLILAAIPVIIKLSLVGLYGRHVYSRCYYGSDTRFDELLIGCAYALLATTRAPKEYPQAFRFLGVLSLFICGYIFSKGGESTFEPFLLQGGYTVFALSVGSILFALQNGSLRSIRTLLEIAPLRWLGRISYALYLYHVFFTGIDGSDGFVALMLDSGKIPQLGFSNGSIAIALGLILATLSYYCVERPFLKLKKRF